MIYPLQIDQRKNQYFALYYHSFLLNENYAVEVSAIIEDFPRQNNRIFCNFVINLIIIISWFPLNIIDWKREYINLTPLEADKYVANVIVDSVSKVQYVVKFYSSEKEYFHNRKVLVNGNFHWWSTNVWKRTSFLPFLFYSHSSTEESESPWKGSNFCG